MAFIPKGTDGQHLEWQNGGWEPADPSPDITPIENGGTGADNAADAVSHLGLLPTTCASGTYNYLWAYSAQGRLSAVAPSRVMSLNGYPIPGTGNKGSMLKINDDGTSVMPVSATTVSNWLGLKTGYYSHPVNVTGIANGSYIKFYISGDFVICTFKLGASFEAGAGNIPLGKIPNSDYYPEESQEPWRWGANLTTDAPATETPIWMAVNISSAGNLKVMRRSAVTSAVNFAYIQGNHIYKRKTS